MVVQLDEPLADPAPLNVRYISRLARENGIKVMLSGTGGDDIFSGCRRHTAAALDSFWGYVPQWFRSGLSSGTHSPVLRQLAGRRMSKLLSGIRHDAEHRLVHSFAWMAPERIAALLTADLFGVPLRSWLKGSLSGLADDLLSRNTLLHRGFFDPAAVERLRKDDSQGKVDASNTIFSLICIELWAKRFIDNTASSELS